MQFRRDSQLTKARLRYLFRYRRDGFLVRRVDTGNSDFAGDVVTGSKMRSGYLNVSIDGNRFLYHRIVFKWHHGRSPEYIDHKDRNRSNNRISNLRAVKAHQNSSNCKTPTTNTSGVKGVVWRPDPRRWVAIIGHRGKSFHLYCGKSKIAAVAARRKAEKKFHGRFS